MTTRINQYAAILPLCSPALIINPLTVLALVPLVACRAAAGGLVAHVDGALAVIEAVVLACLPVTGGPSEAFGASAGGSTWEAGRRREGDGQSTQLLKDSPQIQVASHINSEIAFCCE